MIRYSAQPILMPYRFIPFSTMLYIDHLVQYTEGFIVVGVNHILKQLPACSSPLSPGLPIIEPAMRARETEQQPVKHTETNKKGAFVVADFVLFNSQLELPWHVFIYAALGAGKAFLPLLILADN